MVPDHSSAVMTKSDTTTAPRRSVAGKWDVSIVADAETLRDAHRGGIVELRERADIGKSERSKGVIEPTSRTGSTSGRNVGTERPT